MPESDCKILQMNKYILIHQQQKHNSIYTINCSEIKNQQWMEMMLNSIYFMDIIWYYYKIVQNGFNRDFNRNAPYGKGVYFAKNAHIVIIIVHPIDIMSMILHSMIV